MVESYPMGYGEEEEEIQEVVSPERGRAFPPVVGWEYALPHRVELTVAVQRPGDLCIKDSSGALLFMLSARRDTTRSKRVLLTASGVPLLCAHRKLLSLYNRWDAYRGDQPKPEDALFSVKRSSYFQLKTSLNVFLASSKKDNKPDFKVKGNYPHRKCTIFCGSTTIAEVQQKLEVSKDQLSKNTFVIIVHPGTDYAFVTSLIVIMDEIHKEQDQTIESSNGVRSMATNSD